MDRIISAKPSFRDNNDFDSRNKNIRLLQCPICLHVYVHLGYPILQEGNDNYEAVDGLFRGDAIKIPFECEQGHSGNFYFAFHKGNTFYWVQDTTE